MTAVDGDGIDEDLTRAVSVAMLAAARAGEQVARMTQAASREREARAAGNIAEAQRQVEAHTEAAKAYFEVVTRPEYLSVTPDEQIRQVAKQAESWSERLPEAQRAADAATHALKGRRPGQVGERSVVLAAESEAADRRERLPDPAAPTVRVEQPSALQAAAIAEVAQARPAREATVVAQRSDAASRVSSRPARMRSQQKGAGR